ncbi:hypothetical protein GP476_00100 (plasmid) [Aeromonas dhakensis]|uniref:Ig-like domain-containing protein n=1 Tax=Aeromonas dhakensis TaxID=196024 RepID=UPI0021B25319|nr:Ig-like domain-containing protein [Aeromonas dhakensis]UXB09954.1 hypothetical protein GP476_00100 [Aeromonas dhakensis]
MQKVKVTNQVFRRSTVAFALLSALVGQVAIAAVSSNTAGPINGHQIVIDSDPTLVGDGAVGTDVTATVPTVTDADGDKLEDWKYVWTLDGVEVGSEASAGSTTAIPPYTVQPEDAGKQLALCLKAVAEARSYPEPTRTSAQRCTTNPLDLTPVILTLKAGSLTLTNDNALSDGVDKDTAQVLVVNGKGDPVAGVTVHFSNDIDSTTSEAVTDANGLATYSFTSTKGGSGTLIADLMNGSPYLSVPIYFKPIISGVSILDASTRAAPAANPLVGTTLMAEVNSNFNSSGVNPYTYKWMRNHKAVTGTDQWEDIPDATGASYTTIGADQGYEISVDVTVN